MRFAGGIIPQRGWICKTFPQKNFPSARRRHARREDSRQAVKKVPSSRHVRMDGTQPGKFGAESVRAALRRVRGSAPNFVPRGIPGGRNFCPAYAGRNGFPLERGAKAPRWSIRCRSADAFWLGQVAVSTSSALISGMLLPSARRALMWAIRARLASRL